jgi:hypothetical protein
MLALAAGAGAVPAPLIGRRAEEVAVALKGAALRERSVGAVAGVLRQESYLAPSAEVFWVPEADRPRPKSNADGVAMYHQRVIRFRVRGERFRYETLCLTGSPGEWAEVGEAGAGLTNGQPIAPAWEPPRSRPLPVYVSCGNGTERRDYSARAGEMLVSAQRRARNPLLALLLLGRWARGGWTEEITGPASLAGCERLDLPVGTVQDLAVGTRRAIVRELDDERAGCRCLRVVSLHDHQGARQLVRLWLAPSLGYAVVRAEEACLSGAVEAGRAAQGSAIVFEGSDFVDAGNALWLPSKSRTAAYIWRSPAAVQWTESSTAAFVKIEPNPPEQPGEFEFEPPLGTAVSNTLTGRITFVDAEPVLWRRLAGPTPPLLSIDHLLKAAPAEVGKR